MNFICEYQELDRNNNTLPSIKDGISDFAIKNKERILRYLKSGKTKFISPSAIVDIFTGKTVNIELCIYTDGAYAWSSETMYYFEKYNLKLNQDFIDFVLSKK